MQQVKRYYLFVVLYIGMLSPGGLIAQETDTLKKYPGTRNSPLPKKPHFLN